ncbi:MAG: tripartite tricarboxylate transporter substrate binding protein [Pseudomonadota bacterium]
MKVLPRFGLVFAILTSAYVAPTQALESAAAYPGKPVRMIVTFPPGGGADMIARAVGQKLFESWGQQIVVDNRGGAGGIIGTEIAARSAPDGYTLLVGASSGLVINPLLRTNLPYDPVRDFMPVSLLIINPTLLVVNSSVPVNSVKELIALAKAKPGQLNYASVGQGSPIHLAMELFKSMTGANFVHVPYKGSGPAVTDLLASHVQLMFNSMTSVLPHVKTGRLRGLAVGSAQRFRAVPDIPTVAEAGVPGFEAMTWYGMFAPAGTPKYIINKLNTQIVKILANPEMAHYLVTQGSEARSSTPEELAKYMRVESERAKKAIQSAAIRIE